MDETKDGKPVEDFTVRDYKYLSYGLEVVQLYEDNTDATIFFPYRALRYAKLTRID